MFTPIGKKQQKQTKLIRKATIFSDDWYYE